MVRVGIVCHTWVCLENEVGVIPIREGSVQGNHLDLDNNQNQQIMGSTGTGRFSDYTGETSKDPSSKQGGKSGEDKCLKAFTTNLEEVERSAYFKKHSKPPEVQTVIKIVFENPRLAAEAKGLVIGYLPTDFNYVRTCMNAGFVFPGIVSSSSASRVPSVRITVTPHK